MGKEVIAAMKELETRKKNELREQIVGFEGTLSTQDGAFFGDSVNCPLTHKFTDGIYVREIFIPAGTYIVGKIHKHAHPNFLMSGIVHVITETGGHQKLKGPMSIISPPGTKRALKAITDLVWITVHHNPTNTQDLKELEKIVIAESYEEYHAFIEKKEKVGLIGWFNKIVKKVQLKLIRS